MVFLKGFRQFKGVRRLTVVNQFAQLQMTRFECCEREIGRHNSKVIRWAIEESDIVIIRWGSSIRFEDRKTYVLNLLERVRTKTLLQTPMHTSRGRYQAVILPLMAQPLAK